MPKKPICPECVGALEPHEYADTKAVCPDCGYEWFWVAASNGEYDD